MGDEFDKFKDIEISFSMASQNQIFIDELAFTYNSKNSKQFVFSPANLSLFQIHEDGENLKIAIDFNNSNCVIYQVYHPEYMGTELDSIQYIGRKFPGLLVESKSNLWILFRQRKINF